jgi:hypothetical protein
VLNKNKMKLIALQSQDIVYTTISDVCMAIQLHAELGDFEMEVYVDKKKAERFANSLRRKKYSCSVFNFKVLENESRLYVYWGSNF